MIVSQVGTEGMGVAAVGPQALTAPDAEAPSTPWFWPAVLSITLFGLVARILFVSLAQFERIANDAKFFRTTAHNLVSGIGYAYPFPTDPTKAVATAAHPPLFSLVLSIFDLVGLQSVEAQLVALAVVSSAAVPVMGLVGRRLLSPAVGAVAAAIAALHPLWLQTVGSLMSESVYLVVVAGVLLAALRALDRPTGWRLLALGASIGVASLVRSEAILMVVLVGFPVALMGIRGWKSTLRTLGVLLAGCLALIAPWMIRNEIQLGTASLSTQAGVTLIGSYCSSTFEPHDPTFGSFNGTCADVTAAVFIRYVKPPAGASQWNEVSLNHQLTQSAEHFARLHLGQLPRVVAAREVSAWALTGQGYQQTLAVYGGGNATFEELGGVVYWILAPFALAGSVAMARRSWQRLFILMGPIVAVVVTVAMMYGSSRLRVLAEPSLALLAAVGAVIAVKRIRPTVRLASD